MSFIYFIHEKGNLNLFKIGKTACHPADRLAQLQTGNPRRLLIYRWLKIGDHSTAEEYLHCRFCESRVLNEWFAINTDQIDLECAIILQNNEGSIVSGEWQPINKAEVREFRARKKLNKIQK